MLRTPLAASLCLLASLSGAAPLFSQDPIPESEPNDSIATADTAVLGGRVSGHSDAANDVDYWVLEARAGDTIYVDVDASEFHSTMVPGLLLTGPDGASVWRDYGDGWDGEDPYIEYVARKSGAYYLRITGKTEAGHGASAFYTINFRRARCPVVSSEHEPNNTRATARALALQSPVNAVSCPNGDADLYVVDVTHPSRINVEMFTPEQWQPVLHDPRYPPVSSLRVYSDTALLASKDWRMARKDSMRLGFDADKPGSYYVIARTSPGGFRFTYTLRASETLYHGPGDPVVTITDNVGPYSRDIAVSTTGDLYVPDGPGQRILKVTPTGVVTEFVTGIGVVQDALAFDAAGNLYAVGGGSLYRITPDGHYTVLAHVLTAWGLAIGPDGSIWVAESGLLRYSPTGRLLTSSGLSSGTALGGIRAVAFSPTGQLYVADDATIYRFTDGRLEAVLHDEPWIHRFAIDSAGRFYVSSEGFPIGAYGLEGRIDLFAADGTVLQSPFARTPVMPTALAFGRNSDGTPNRRLFFIDGHLGEVRPGLATLGEVKPGSIDIPGGRDPIASERAMRELLHPGSVLTPEERAALDASGNRNGRYDIGDVRLLLTRAGALP